jgi:dihydrodipicolinate synthase/N-acetylneuraminate lyase
MPRYHQTVLVSCEIPWDEREQLMPDLFRREIRMLRALGFHDLYIFGTAGEGYAVDTARFREIVTLFREETNDPAVRPMVGVIGLSTATVVERVAEAYELGFRTFQISLPSWGALNDHELLTFFVDVCGSFPDAAFLHYNLPRAKRVLTGADYRRVLEQVPNLVATKNTGGGAQRAADLMSTVPELQHFFGEDNFLHGCLYGECSLLSSFAPMVPARTWEYFHAAREHRLERALLLQHGFRRLLNEVLGPLLARERMDGAYDKLIVRLGGLEELPLRLLSPYQGFGEDEYLVCRTVFRERYTDEGPAWS